MKCLITGGAGFIGSHLADLLIEKNHEIIVIDNLSKGKKDYVNSSSKFFEIDICDKESLKKVFFEEKPEIVFHLAAQASVIVSTEDPSFDAKVNILGSLNILELCREFGVKKIIYSNSGGAGSGEPQYIPIDENHPIEPMCHYGISKHTVEHYLNIYHKLYGINYVSLRYANIYGPRQDPYGEGGVIAIFTNKLLNNEKPTIYGDGNQTRDFMYVGDVAEINLLCMNNVNNKILNVGTEIETSVNDIFFGLKEIMDSNLDPVYADKRKGEIERSVLNITKLKQEFSWEPKVMLKEGLRKTVDSFRN